MKRFTLLFLAIVIGGLSMNGQSALRKNDMKKTGQKMTKDLSSNGDLNWFTKGLEATKLSQDIGTSIKTVIAPYNSVLQNSKYAKSWEAKEMGDIKTFLAKCLISKKVVPGKMMEKLNQASGGIKFQSESGKSVRFFKRGEIIMVEGITEKPRKLEMVLHSADGVIYAIK
jgi:hypothetical protein